MANFELLIEQGGYWAEVALRVAYLSQWKSRSVNIWKLHNENAKDSQSQTVNEALISQSNNFLSLPAHLLSVFSWLL